MNTKKIFVLIGIIVILGLFCVSACKILTHSPDRKYQCEKWKHLEYYPKYPPIDEISFVIREVKTQRVVIITNGKYDSPNDVKAEMWSPDSKKFAAFYHYGESKEKAYTWIGVWSLETGELLYSLEKPGWIEIYDDKFPEPPKSKQSYPKPTKPQNKEV